MFKDYWKMTDEEIEHLARKYNFRKFFEEDIVLTDEAKARNRKFEDGGGVGSYLKEDKIFQDYKIELEKKYGKDSDVMVTIIRTWSKSHKDVSVSVNGWLISSILDTFKGFVEMVKQRSFGDRMLGRNKGDKD